MSAVPRRGKHKLRVRHSRALYTHLLSAEMYTPHNALWEGVKNAWDADIRLLRLLQQMKEVDDYKALVDLMFYKNHPLSPDGPAMVILDNGEGMTDPSLDRYTTVGPEDENFKTYGVLDRKRIGRIGD